MSRGSLRVYLGPAPGAGTTYRMLEEGNRRLRRGSDVVIGFVETHQRPHTAAQIGTLEVVDRAPSRPGGPPAGEMDLAAILARRPSVVLVDDLAARNSPDSPSPTRWQDVLTLLDAGIDVVTTLEIAQLESVQDVVERITGAPSVETVPDAVVRGADQIELVDITPEALRRRMAHGNIYPADRIDASLSNYFKVENLTALRQLAMLWVSDLIEVSLQDYLVHHEATGPWETRERLIVAVNGSTTDQSLMRRAARIAARTGADLVAVHVVAPESQRDSSTDMSATRAYLTQFGGTLQEIVDDDVATALVSFARLEHATQIVLGSGNASRTRRGGVVAGVLRHARDLDIHIISTQPSTPVRLQRRRKSPFTWRRRASALVGALFLLPLLTWLLSLISASAAPAVVFPVYLTAVIALTVWGGTLVGIFSAVAAALLENYYFIAPRHTLEISRTQDVVTLTFFLAFSIGASVVVTAFTKRSNEAERSRVEAEILTTAAATVAASQDDLPPILDSLRAIFDLDSVEILTENNGTWSTELVSGDARDASSEVMEFPIDRDHLLRLHGPSLDAHDRAMVTAFLGRLAAGLQAQRVQRESAELRALAETDALRTGLLRAVSHDLRTPLASIEANVSSLLAQDVTWSPLEQREFLSSIEREVHRLTRLVTNLLDAGRLEAGVVTPRSVNVELDDLIASALETIDTQGRRLEICLPDELPVLRTDPDLYERVVANVVSNACRFSPPEEPVRITAGVAPGVVDLLVIDRGPGIDHAKRASMLAPFQRLDDDRSGAGLGLSVASGFLGLLGGEIRFEDTPGGGLTVVIELRQGLET